VHCASELIDYVLVKAWLCGVELSMIVLEYEWGVKLSVLNDVAKAPL
jgi:hypothetical protein